MYNRGMKQRIIFAFVFVCVAWASLFIRYVPPRVTDYALGDPLAPAIFTNFGQAEWLGNAVVRPVQSNAALQIPLADRRGAQAVAITLRSAAPNGLLRLRFGFALVVAPTSKLRTYHVLASSATARTLNVALEPVFVRNDALPAISVARVTVYGRGGWPAPPDLLALTWVALIPALLLLLTARLPYDWSLLIGAAAVGLIALVPVSSRTALLQFGPLLTTLIAGVAMVPQLRAQPGMTLVLLGGLALRGFGLGWGSGYIFQVGEQQIVSGAYENWFTAVIQWLAESISTITGNAAWRAPWGIVLIGRACSAALGTALIAAVYVLGAALLPRRWALLAAAYVAIVPLLVQQSHYASSSQAEALLVVLLLWGCSRMVHRPHWSTTLLTLGLAGLVLVLVPAGAALLSAVVVAQLGVIRLPALRRHAAMPAVVGVGVLAGVLVARWSYIGRVFELPSAHATSDAAAAGVALGSGGSSVPYIGALVGLLMWGLGPLLLQIGVVGWGAGFVRSMQTVQGRVWLPVLVGMAAYFAVAGYGSAATVRSLTPLAPLLCLTAALLLSLFARRLHYRLGQRTVRLLGGTTFGLGLAVSLGLLSVYHVPDARISASRWLIAQAEPNSVLLLDTSVAEQLPLGVANLFRIVRPPSAAAQDAATLERYVDVLTQADYILIATDRGSTAAVPRTDPLAACYYSALFEGRLGFVPRANFAVVPRIIGVPLDDSRSDPRLRMDDHPPLRVFKRVVQPTPDALRLMLHCAAP